MPKLPDDAQRTGLYLVLRELIEKHGEGEGMSRKLTVAIGTDKANTPFALHINVMSTPENEDSVTIAVSVVEEKFMDAFVAGMEGTNDRIN